MEQINVHLKKEIYTEREIWDEYSFYVYFYKCSKTEETFDLP